MPFGDCALHWLLKYFWTPQFINFQQAVKGENMDKVFDVARQTMASIELYRDFYSSGQPSSDHVASLVNMLRARAGNTKNSEPQASNFYNGFADCIEMYVFNKSPK
jgi:hypothetical protein